jgi:hypothetical protein
MFVYIELKSEKLLKKVVSMFGMLDYRAHKLYLLMFGVPWFLFRWMIIIGLPFVYYAIGLQLAENRLLQIITSLIALFFIEIIVAVAVTYLDKLFMFIFNLFVDVISVDERTKEESLLVVKNGDVAIKLIEIGKKHPKDWSDEDIAFYHRGFFAWFFREKIIQRFENVRNYFIENPNLFYNGWDLNGYLSKNNLSISLLEKIVTNSTYRVTAISYSITIILLISNPFN